MIPFGIAKRLKKGYRLYCFVTLKCNLNCGYCTHRFYNKKMPHCPEMSLEEWKELIDTFPVKIREVVITGGEPTNWYHFAELVEYLSYKYFVTVFTNLNFYWSLDGANKSKILFISTYHQKDNKEKFLKNYNLYKENGIKIKIDELINQEIEGSRTKDWCSLESLKKDKRLLIYPDGTLFTDAYSGARYCHERYSK